MEQQIAWSERTDQRSKLLQYLQQLNALTAELEASMHAIAGNDLSGLQRSLVQQELLAAELMYLAKAGDGSAEVMPFDEPLREKLKNAAIKLKQTSLRYDVLLRQSMETVTMMLNLCSSQAGVYREARRGFAGRRTWSCAM